MSVQEQKMMTFPSVAQSREWKKIAANLPSPSCLFFCSVLDKEINYKSIYKWLLVVTHLVQNFSTNPSHKWEESTH
jgi:hypothetical protein